MNYTKLTKEHIKQLQTIIDPKRVITDAKFTAPYAHDQTAMSVYANSPEVVIYPHTTKEVQVIVLFANEHRIAITPRGAGSGLAGGAVPWHNGIVLAFEQMNQLLEIDTQNLTVTVEPGMITNVINQALEPYGLYFAGYPMSLQRCMIGGNVATNAGGGKAIKYGVTGRYILGMQVVTPTGYILELGGKLVKNVTGYDLKHLFIGSEGTLGIITQLTIQLTPLPKAASAMFVWFKEVQDAVQIVPAIMTTLGITPTAIELIDQTTMKLVCDTLNESFYRPHAQATLLIEVDGVDQATTDQQLQHIEALCNEHGAIETFLAKEKQTQERLWALRRGIADSLKAISPEMSLEDMVLPIAAIKDYMPHVKRLEAKYNILMPTYGHAGDGNLHTTLLKDSALSDAQWHTLEHQILTDLYTVVHSLGGKISGEHGIGIKRKSHLKNAIDPAELALMKAIKQVLDPNNILNPGKIFDIP
jgi:glycolate oxidase